MSPFFLYYSFLIIFLSPDSDSDGDFERQAERTAALTARAPRGEAELARDRSEIRRIYSTLGLLEGLPVGHPFRDPGDLFRFDYPAYFERVAAAAPHSTDGSRGVKRKRGPSGDGGGVRSVGVQTDPLLRKLAYSFPLILFFYVIIKI